MVVRPARRDDVPMITEIDNDAGIAFHERHGFVAVARLREVGRKFDRWLDVVFLQLLLDEDQRGQDSA